MFAAIASALTSRLAGPIASVIALCLAAALAFCWISGKATEHALNGRISSLEVSIDDPKLGWRARLGQCEANAGELRGKITAQNTDIQTWKDAANAATSRANALATAAHAARTQAEQSAQATLALKPGADHCAAALDLIRSP